MAWRTSLLVGVALTWLASALPLARQPTDGFALAVGGADGILVPIARFDGSTWERIWTEPSAAPAVPPALDATPAAWFPFASRVPATWFLWLVDDPQVVASPFEPRAARRLTVTRPVGVAARCQVQVGLQTDRAPQVEPPSDPGRRRVKDGVALSTETIRVEQAVILPPASPFGASAAERAQLAFHRSEDDQIELLEPAGQKQIPPFTARRAVPVAWTYVARLGAAQAPTRTFYLEGETQYGDVAMAGHVWVQIDKGRETADAEVSLTDLERRDVRHRLPLGVLRVGRRRFWVFEAAQWQQESYEIVEASGDGQRPAHLLDVAGGGC